MCGKMFGETEHAKIRWGSSVESERNLKSFSIFLNSFLMEGSLSNS
jgi:hypothetical protein